MASSRASSPATEGMSPSPSQLTPRSKVKAMLAALDGDSDDGNLSTPKTLKFSSKVDLKAISSADDSQTRAQSKDAGSNGTDGDDDDEEVLYKPRGRLAARMHAVHPDTEEDGDDEGDTARDRVRKLFMKQGSSPKADAAEKESASEETAEASSTSRKIKLGRKMITPTSSASNAGRTSPGGLFVSPSPTRSHKSTGNASDSEDELPSNPTANARFLALVQKKREERLAKEAENERQRAKKATERARLKKNHLDILEDDAIEYSDDDGGRQLTQQVRPTRKASKKAVEEMHRETQRMSRNMQLAHQARTKKKITKSSLFAKFNYKPVGFVESDPIEQLLPSSSSSTPYTDVEMRDTPPTSPVSLAGDKANLVDVQTGDTDLEIRELPQNGTDGKEHVAGLEEVPAKEIASSPPLLATTLDKGKGKAPIEAAPLLGKMLETEQKGISNRRPLRIQPPKAALKGTRAGDDSDSDLEIMPMRVPECRTKDSIFDRVPAKQAKESHSLHALRMLAHLTSPGKQQRGKNTKPSMTAAELQISLQQRARKQAAREREERLKALKESGVIVQTAEERVKEMADMEDLIAKARREGEEIMRREKEAVKKDRKANGEADPLGDSDDDDEWEEENDKSAEQIYSSGSESDGDDEGDASGEEEFDDKGEDAMSVEEDEDESLAAKPVNSLLDDEASETDSAEAVEVASDQEDVANFINDGDDVESSDKVHDDRVLPPTAYNRRRTRTHIILDDEDDEDDMGLVLQSPIVTNTKSPLGRTVNSPIAPPSVLRSATKTFIPGLTVAGPAGLGLTQIFAGTMDDTQTQPFEDSQDIESPLLNRLDSAQDSIAFLKKYPAPTFPSFEPTMNEESQEIIRDSQTQISQIPESPLTGADSQNIQLHLSQSQIHGFDSMLQDPTATQFSEFPEPTQDAGFQAMSPIKGRFVELAPSTMDTVILEQTVTIERIQESPVAKKKGKLLRRADLKDSPEAESNIIEARSPGNTDEFEINQSVFDVMRKASKKKDAIADEFDKKKSGAKEMVQEQAEESEDEYAGLGGASDDESGGEEDVFVKEMIDDEGGKDVDESKLAAFYADKERANDEKQVEKLFKDITNGMLRRKRGADYDLSESDDDGEARRRMKRKEFAKMRKALLEDERIGKIAENPKKMAFLRAIEDRGEEDEMDFLDDLAESVEGTDSQSQPQPQTNASHKEAQKFNDSQLDIVMGPPKRKLANDAETGNRLPPHLRRTQPAKRPSNLSEIRQSLSSLIEEPNAILQSHDSSVSEGESENGDSDTETTQKEKENRDPFASRRKTSIAVVDRISLKRASSNATSMTTRLAFAAPSSMTGFKVPALLRRTTTNTSITSGSSSSSISGTERTAGSFGTDGNVAKKAGKNSGVHYFARENERKMKVEEAEKRRKKRRFKGAEGRRKAVGGLFGMGAFE